MLREQIFSGFLWPPQKMNFSRKLPVIICYISIYEPTANHIQSKCTISPSCDEALSYANVHNQLHQFAAHDPMCPKYLFTCGFQLFSPFSRSLSLTSPQQNNNARNNILNTCTMSSVVLFVIFSSRCNFITAVYWAW